MLVIAFVLLNMSAMRPAVATRAQVFDMRVPVSPTAVPVAGSPRLVYELHLVNVSRETLVLEQVEVVDAKGARPIAMMSRDALEHHLKRVGSIPDGVGPLTFTPGMRGVVYLWLALDDDARPRTLVHRLRFHVVGQAATRPKQVWGGRTEIRPGSPVALGPPLCGGPWVAVYNPRWERGHRRTFRAAEHQAGAVAHIPGRYAIDWLKVDAQGRLARGDKDVVKHWYGYGASVLAVADGVIAAIRTHMPESATMSGAHPETDAGNYIVLDLGQGRYAFYEHLKPGSIRVAAGEHVRRGQVIAALGFTGHSTGPHLHFHVADTASPQDAEGLPFVFDGFRILGAYRDFDAFGSMPWTPPDHAAGTWRTREMPAPFDVVDFEVGATSVSPSGCAGAVTADRPPRLSRERQ